MDYCCIDEAREQDGLRLALTAGIPAPWSEAAKAVFRYKNIPFTAVAQVAGEENEALVAWTGHRNAPTAMYNGEPPAVTWLDLVNLAERLEPEPSLLPADMEQRITMLGLLNELAGENGLLWNGRHLMFRAMKDAFGEEALQDNPMLRDYRYSNEAAGRAAQRVMGVLDRLARQLEDQAAAGSRFFFGDAVSALDLYWAPFSQVLQPLPKEVNPMPDSLRKAWGGVATLLEATGYTTQDILLEQRQFIFEEFIGLPLDF